MLYSSPCLCCSLYLEHEASFFFVFNTFPTSNHNVKRACVDATFPIGKGRRCLTTSRPGHTNHGAQAIDPHSSLHRVKLRCHNRSRISEQSVWPPTYRRLNVVCVALNNTSFPAAAPFPIASCATARSRRQSTTLPPPSSFSISHPRRPRQCADTTSLSSFGAGSLSGLSSQSAFSLPAFSYS